MLIKMLVNVSSEDARFYFLTTNIPEEVNSPCYPTCRGHFLLLLTFLLCSHKSGTVLGRPERRRPLGRPRPRWEDNIKMDLQAVGWGMDWTELAQGRDRWRALVNEVMNLRVP
jgi:hypothetical protein